MSQQSIIPEKVIPTSDINCAAWISRFIRHFSFAWHRRHHIVLYLEEIVNLNQESPDKDYLVECARILRSGSRRDIHACDRAWRAGLIEKIRRQKAFPSKYRRSPFIGTVFTDSKITDQKFSTDDAKKIAGNSSFVIIHRPDTLKPEVLIDSSEKDSTETDLAVVRYGKLTFI